MFVIPKHNLKIPDPAMQDYLPPEGREVAPNSYWTRRLSDGDVTQGKAPTSTKPPRADNTGNKS